jgi:hypothetical protein
LNVPFTTTLLTGGAAVLFLLWYITPRVFFEQTGADKSIREMRQGIGGVIEPIL